MNEQSMVERVARAMWAKRAAKWDAMFPTKSLSFDDGEQSARDFILALSRAAIEAMPAPTETMVIHGFEAMTGNWHSCREAADDARRCYEAMISAALADSAP